MFIGGHEISDRAYCCDALGFLHHFAFALVEGLITLLFLLFLLLILLFAIPESAGILQKRASLSRLRFLSVFYLKIRRYSFLLLSSHPDSSVSARAQNSCHFSLGAQAHWFSFGFWLFCASSFAPIPIFILHRILSFFSFIPAAMHCLLSLLIASSSNSFMALPIPAILFKS
jgi:hypothetical protein